MLVAASVAGTAGAQAPPIWTVAGVVRDSAGKPLGDVELRIEGGADGLGARSNTAGSFAFSVASDSIRLVARRLGFQPRTTVVGRPASGARVDVDIRLLVAPVELEAVTAAEGRQVFDARLAGFYSRSQTKNGHFIGRERLGRLTSYRFTDVLREIPGVRFGMLGKGGTQERTIRLRGANCPPTVFFDGLPASAGEYELDAIDLGSVEGIEIYNGLATIPAVFVAPRGAERCGVIAIWSRPSRKRQ